MNYLHELGIVHGDLKGVSVDNCDFVICLAEFMNRRTFSLTTTVPPSLQTLVLQQFWLTSTQSPLSATVISSAGTFRWMSPELLFEKGYLPTQESDRYALGMVIYEVSGRNYSNTPLFTRLQVLTGLSPFHHLGPFAVVIAVREGEHPKRPPHEESPGFSDRLWELSLQCWDRSPSARPTAQELLHCLQDISYTRVLPLEYPISDGLGEEAGSDFIPGDGWGIVVGVLKSCLWAAMLHFLSLPPS